MFCRDFQSRNEFRQQRHKSANRIGRQIIASHDINRDSRHEKKEAAFYSSSDVSRKETSGKKMRKALHKKLFRK